MIQLLADDPETSPRTMSTTLDVATDDPLVRSPELPNIGAQPFFAPHRRRDTGAARASAESLRDHGIGDIYADGYASIPINPVSRAVVEAISEAAAEGGWTDSGGQSDPTYRHPTNKEQGAVFVTVKSPGGDVGACGDILPQIWDTVRSLDDLTSDVLLIVLAAWTKHSQGPGEPVWISADDILDARGVQRRQYQSEPDRWNHGHRREDRLSVGRALDRLGRIWLHLVNVEATPARSGRKASHLTFESRALVVTDRMTRGGPEAEPVLFAAAVMPGAWAKEYWHRGLRQTGLLAQKALEYDPYREKVEKRLAKYVAFSFRWNAYKHAGTVRLKVGTLLKEAGLEIEGCNPRRSRDRLERALDRLVADCVIAGWSYVEDVHKLPPRDWTRRWRAMTVTIEYPDKVRNHYSTIQRPRKAAR